MTHFEKELIDFEVPIKAVNDLPLARLRKNTCYYVDSRAFMLCPCECGSCIEIEAPYKWDVGKHGLTVSPELISRSCGTKFVIAHGTAYGQAPLPPKKKRKENNMPPDEIKNVVLLKFTGTNTQFSCGSEFTLPQGRITPQKIDDHTWWNSKLRSKRYALAKQYGATDAAAKLLAEKDVK